jgi:hypothetical protein
MYQKAKAFLKPTSTRPHSIEELNAILDQGGFAKMAFCGKAECELKIKELTNGGTARCIASMESPRRKQVPDLRRGCDDRRLLRQGLLSFYVSIPLDLVSLFCVYSYRSLIKEGQKEIAESAKVSR